MSYTVPKSSRLFPYLNYRLRVTLTDSRIILGKFLSFDKHMNLVLADAQELREYKDKTSRSSEYVKRPLGGLLLLRGENVVSIQIEAPPSQEETRTTAIIAQQKKADRMPVQTGMGRGATLNAPIRGFGGAGGFGRGA